VYEFYWSETREGLAGQIAHRLRRDNMEWQEKFRDLARYAVSKALVIPKKFGPEGHNALHASKFLDLDLIWGFAYPMGDLWESEGEQAYESFTEDDARQGYEFVDEVLRSDAFALLCKEHKKAKEAQRAEEKAERERVARSNRKRQYEKLKEEFEDE